MNNISATQAAAWLASGEAVLIDVREPDEFRAGHVVHALSLPLSALDDCMAQLDIPAERKLIFQCLKGARGEKACVSVRGGSCKNEVYNLEGGIDAWKAAGFPVVGVDTSAGGLSIFRQVQIIVGGLIAVLVLLGLTGLSVAFVFAGLFGFALFFAGITGWCGLAMLLSKMPWNK